jgi:transposase
VVAWLIDAASAPVYLEIGEKAAHLRELGMSDRAIARSIGVDDKTVAKSLRVRGGGEQRREVSPPAVSEPHQPG